MTRIVRIGMRSILVTAAMLLVTALPLATAGAQEPGAQEPGTNAAAIVEQTQRYIDALLTADIDGDDIADFDASGDGVGEISLHDFADLPTLPGSPEFMELIAATFELGVTPTNQGTNLSPTCGGMALSFDADGNLIDWALGAGSAHGGDAAGTIVDLFPQANTGASIFTEDNPFVVGERVVVIGQLVAPDEAAISDTVAGWSVTSAGVELGNGVTSAANNGIIADQVHIADHAIAGVAQPVGVFPLDAHVEVAEMMCQTSGWVQFDQGLPLLTNVGIAASGLSVLGAAGLLINARPARAWKTEEKA